MSLKAFAVHTAPAKFAMLSNPKRLQAKQLLTRCYPQCHRLLFIKKLIKNLSSTLPATVCGNSQAGLIPSAPFVASALVRYMAHLKLYTLQILINACPCVIHDLNTQACIALGSQVVVNEVLLLQVPLADAAGVVLAQSAVLVTTTRAPAWTEGNAQGLH
jgi:hypothetical protein